LPIDHSPFMKSNRDCVVQVCDARDDDKSVKAWLMIKISLQKPDFVNTDES